MEKAISGQQIEATWGIALKIWWWVFWRGILVVIPVSLLISIVPLLLSVSLKKAEIISLFINVIIGLIIYLYFLKKVLNKKFKDFTLALIRTHQLKKIE